MPCRTDHMDPTAKEIEWGRLLMLEKEFETSKHVNPDEYKRAYKYDPTQKDLDSLTAKLCEALHMAESLGELGEFSLEMQLWWRDHKAADKKRIKKELKEAKDEEARQAALAKLTPHERNLLGL